MDLDLAPTAMAAGGDAIARDADGRVVFVTGALPGERVRARVTETKKDFAKAVVVDVLSPSPDRVAPPCPALAAGCGGCGWQHVAVDAQRRLKRSIVVDALRRLGRLGDRAESVVDAGGVALPADGYRTTVRLAVDPSTGRGAYRRHGSHELVTPDDCLVLHPLLAARLGDRFPGASEVTLRCGARTGEVLVAPVPGQPSPRWFHEEAAGRRWRISAESFFQVRPDGADALADLVAAVNVRHALRLDTVLLVVAGEPWQKMGTRPISPAADRLALVAAAVGDVEGLEASDIEIRRGGLSYTADTLRELHDLHAGDVELFLVVGGDVAVSLDTWEHVDVVRSLATLVVVNRPGTPSLPALEPAWRVETVDIPNLEISSSDLRARAADGRPLDYLVPEAAVRCIRDRGLYAPR